MISSAVRTKRARKQKKLHSKRVHSKSACSHPASITTTPHSEKHTNHTIENGDKKAGIFEAQIQMHFCVMCGARLANPVMDKKKKKSGLTLRNNTRKTKNKFKLPRTDDRPGINSPLTGREVGITEYTTDRNLSAHGGVMKSRCSDFVVEEIRWDTSVVAVKTAHIDIRQSFGYWHQGEAPTPITNFLIGSDESSFGYGAVKKKRKIRKEIKKTKKKKKLKQPTRINKNAKPQNQPTETSFHSTQQVTHDPFPSPHSSRVIAQDQSFRDRSSTISSMQRLNTRFILIKANCSTFEAIRMISDATGIAQGRFTVAGLKDTTAVTAQEVIALDTTPSDLEGYCKSNPRLRLVIDSEASPTNDRLFPGASRGNKFRIVLRDVDLAGSRMNPRIDDTGNDEHLDSVLKIAKQVQTRGFVNYFGEQRFGGNSTRNTDIGRFYIQQKYLKLVNAVLGLPPWGHPKSAMETKARSVWEQSHGSVLTVQRLMPKLDELVVENTLLNRLGRAIERESAQFLSEKVCRNAWLSVPFMNRLLVVNAYFSKVWNLMTSVRLRRHGTKVVKGDLVKLYAEPGTDYYKRDNNGKSNAFVNDTVQARRQCAKQSWMIHTVSENDVNLNKFSICDVVLPLAGDQVEYPTNDIGSLYRSYLMYDGVIDKRSLTI